MRHLEKKLAANIKMKTLLQVIKTFAVLFKYFYTLT